MAKRSEMICFRVTSAQKQRIATVVQRIMERHPLVSDRSVVLRDLIGLTNYGLATDEDRQLLMDPKSQKESDMYTRPLVEAVTESSKKARKKA